MGCAECIMGAVDGGGMDDCVPPAISKLPSLAAAVVEDAISEGDWALLDLDELSANDESPAGATGVADDAGFNLVVIMGKPVSPLLANVEEVLRFAISSAVVMATSEIVIPPASSKPFLWVLRFRTSVEFATSSFIPAVAVEFGLDDGDKFVDVVLPPVFQVATFWDNDDEEDFCSVEAARCKDSGSF